MISDIRLFGLDSSHLVQFQQQYIDPAVLPALERLFAHARSDGFDLRLVSAFRGYNQQQSIWDRKFSGLRPLLDANSTPIDSDALNDIDKVRAILLWSALPGASRHHWGTDFDICAHNLIPDDQQLQLITQEYQPGGHQYPFALWLDQYLPGSPFFRPYDTNRDLDGLGAIGCEPWHLSFAPLAKNYLEALTPGRLARQLQRQPILGQNAVLDILPELYQRYVLNIDRPRELKVL